MVETLAQVSKKQQAWTTELKRNAAAFISHPSTPYYAGAGAIGAALGTLISAGKHLDFFQNRKPDVEDLGKKIKGQQGRADIPTDPSNGGLEIGEEPSTLSRWMHYFSSETTPASNLSGVGLKNGSFPLVEQEEGWLTTAQPYAPYIATAIAIVCLYGIYRCARNGLPSIPRPDLPSLPTLNPGRFIPSVPRPDLGRWCRKRETVNDSENNSTSTLTGKELGSKDASKTQTPASSTGVPSSVSGTKVRSETFVINPGKVEHSQIEEVKVEQQRLGWRGWSLFSVFRRTNTQVIVSKEKEEESKTQDSDKPKSENSSTNSSTTEGAKDNKDVPKDKPQDSSTNLSTVEDDKTLTKLDDSSDEENKSLKEKPLTSPSEPRRGMTEREEEEALAVLLKHRFPKLPKEHSPGEQRGIHRRSSSDSWIHKPEFSVGNQSASSPQTVNDSVEGEGEGSPRPSGYGQNSFGEAEGSDSSKYSEVYNPGAGATQTPSDSMNGSSSVHSSAELKPQRSVDESLMLTSGIFTPEDAPASETPESKTDESQTQHTFLSNLGLGFLRSKPAPASDS